VWFISLEFQKKKQFKNVLKPISKREYAKEVKKIHFFCSNKIINFDRVFMEII
jgi:hypothetical protein